MSGSSFNALAGSDKNPADEEATLAGPAPDPVYANLVDDIDWRLGALQSIKAAINNGAVVFTTRWFQTDCFYRMSVLRRCVGPCGRSFPGPCLFNEMRGCLP